MFFSTVLPSSGLAENFSVKFSKHWKAAIAHLGSVSTAFLVRKALSHPPYVVLINNIISAYFHSASYIIWIKLQGKEGTP